MLFVFSSHTSKHHSLRATSSSSSWPVPPPPSCMLPFLCHSRHPQLTPLAPPAPVLRRLCLLSATHDLFFPQSTPQNIIHSEPHPPPLPGRRLSLPLVCNLCRSPCPRLTPFAPPAPVLQSLCLLSATGASHSHCAAASGAVRRCLGFHLFLLLTLLLCPSHSVGCSAPTCCLGLRHSSRLHLSSSSCPSSSSSVDCHIAWRFAHPSWRGSARCLGLRLSLHPSHLVGLLHWPSPRPIVLMAVMLPLVSDLRLSFMTALGVVRHRSRRCTRPVRCLLPQGVPWPRGGSKSEWMVCSVPGTLLTLDQRARFESQL